MKEHYPKNVTEMENVVFARSNDPCGPKSFHQSSFHESVNIEMLNLDICQILHDVMQRSSCEIDNRREHNQVDLLVGIVSWKVVSYPYGLPIL